MCHFDVNVLKRIQFAYVCKNRYYKIDLLSKWNMLQHVCSLLKSGQKYAVREVKVILATVLRRLQIKTLSEKIDVMFEVILRPTKPILIEVRRRPKDNCDYFK